MSQTKKLVFGYWGVGASATPIRMLFHYLKIDYENKTILPHEWGALKKQYLSDPSTPFPNMPHLYDPEEDFLLTETLAIPYYICSKYNRLDLFGETPVEQGRVRQLEAVINDLMPHYFAPIFGPEPKAKFEQNVQPGAGPVALVGQISKAIGEKQFITGKLTYADLKAAHLLYAYRAILKNFGVEDPISQHENLIGYIKGVRGLEEFRDFNDGENDLPLLAEQQLPGFQEFKLW